ncbi:xanthine dehydrogenase family protein subunit M [Hyphomicrobium sp.]|uniref:FAD binding domain-containing protein n=1 Tax=Hyphomicrobium sp. TaxID=82 RepID=UPI002D778DB7|nr:xanthine dehydrogenase family protein subunit M [Hyphomicrobium sp.]HET6390418.1 xanthine dehydrogenase family protein subunit M [Hyphomicrobium sp.]
MNRFGYYKARDTGDAVAAAAAHAARAQFIAGGTNVVDYMKLDVLQPDRLVDINVLAKDVHGRIDVTSEGLHLGALVRMAEAQDHPDIKRDYPVIAESLMLAASQQIRNMASLGGNILQKTRCQYFRETSWPCNKRQPGSGCSALEGINREHAVLGTSPACIATYHGDFAQALIALDAIVSTAGPNGNRQIPFGQLHRLPGDTPEVETVLEPGELITSIDVPAGPHTRRSHYLKIRDRQSYQFAVASVAVALDLDGDRVRDVRLALGGVATVPWRSGEAEAVIRGNILDERLAAKAAEAAFAGAEPRQYNKFKVPAGKAAIVRALLEAKAMRI